MKYLGKLKKKTSKEIDNGIFALGFECADRELFKPEKCYDLAAQTGIKYARLSSGWARTEKQKGVYDFAWLEDMVDNLSERGITPWFNVVYGNPIYMPDAPNKNASGCTPMRYGKEALDAWFDYVAALVKHFKGKVIHYEIWNEANSELFWYPGDVDMKEFAEFYKLTVKVVRENDANAIVGTNLDCWAFENPKWYYEFFPCIAAEDMDFFCMHSYAISPEHDFFSGLARLRKIMDDNGLQKTEIWQGEAGFPSWFVENHSMLPKSQSNERRQAVGHLRRLILDRSANLPISNIFHISDLWEAAYVLPGLSNPKDTAWGLLNGRVYTPKKAHETFGYLATVLSGNIICTYHSIPVNDVDRYAEPTEPVRFVFSKDNMPMYGYFLPTDIEAELPVQKGYDFCLNSEENAPLNPVLVDLYEGDVYSLELSVDSQGNKVFKDLPLAEYPVIICDRAHIEIVE